MNPSYFRSNLPVNWQNGMMINARHLVELNEHIISSIHNILVTGVNPTNYGLFPCYDQNYNSLEITGDSPREYFSSELLRCAALMPNGHIINITPETIAAGQYNKSKLTANIDLSINNEQYLLLYLEVNPEYTPVGTPSPDENFDRSPYINLSAQLKHVTLASPQQITEQYRNSHNILPLALYNVSDKNQPTKISQYIPPSISFDAYQPLAKLYELLEKKIDRMLDASNEVMKFIHYDSRGNLPQQIYIDMNVILPPIINVLIDAKSSFKSSLRYQSPVELVRIFKKLAIAVESGYATLHQNRSIEMERYFSEFHGEARQYRNATAIVINTPYSHINLFHTNLEHIISFIQLYVNLFSEISKRGLKTQSFDIDDNFHQATPQTPPPKSPPPHRETPPPTTPTLPNDPWADSLG